MGAEQIGCLVKGPQKIPAVRIKAAVRACKRKRATLLGDAGDDSSRSERMSAALSTTGEYFDPADIPDDPQQEIRSFVQWWHHIDSRDTCSRQDPDDPRQVLVYAGDMSWGDEPDGAGYRKLKQAMAWGYAEALGIR